MWLFGTYGRRQDAEVLRAEQLLDFATPQLHNFATSDFLKTTLRMCSSTLRIGFKVRTKRIGMQEGRLDHRYWDIVFANRRLDYMWIKITPTNARRYVRELTAEDDWAATITALNAAKGRRMQAAFVPLEQRVPVDEVHEWLMAQRAEVENEDVNEAEEADEDEEEESDKDD